MALMVDSGKLPHNPVGPPTLTSALDENRVGLFAVNLSSASPQHLQLRSREAISPVAFLFKIELASSKNSSFIWAVS